MQNNTDELSRFKIDINLVEYAQSKGYEIDKRKSCVNSTVMRLGDDKIVIATDVDEHGIFFSMRDDQDNGSIIDFVQNRENLNLGQVRKKLRPWLCLGTTAQRSRQPTPPKPRASTADYHKVILDFARCDIRDQSLYLRKDRGLDPAIMKDKRFLWRVDKRGNVVFPHYRNNALTGCEIKGRRFTGFTKSGQKSLWQSTNILQTQKIVICESAIDCMSHAQMFSDPTTGYISIGGGLSMAQLTQLQKGLQWASEKGCTIVIATDNDQGGEQLADKIQSLHPDIKMIREKSIEKDWNKQLEQNQIAKNPKWK